MLTDLSFLASGASNLGEKELVERILADTNSNVRPVINPSDAVNVTLDITFHGVIEMVSNISFSFGIDIAYFPVVFVHVCTARNQLYKLDFAEITDNFLFCKYLGELSKFLNEVLHTFIHGQFKRTKLSQTKPLLNIKGS